MTDIGAEGQPVAVVTGGGAGIGAATAEELGRNGWYVVTLDPLVTLDGTERLPDAEQTTAGRIVAAGGAAEASTASVTDPDGVRDELARVVKERGRLDAVVNVAGITRASGFATGTESDWRSLLSVHLDGYRNVLEAALPMMAAAGRGRILGVTSGSGWRPADAGAYSCAKRAVAALTWQLGRQAPAGVTVNAMSPIAATRMVMAALAKAGGGQEGGPPSTGGLSLGSIPTPDALGPLAAHLVSEAFAWCSGQVIFVGGPEAAVLDRPRLLEVLRAGDDPSLAHVMEMIGTLALVPAEANQASGGGSNPRFGPVDPNDPLPPAAVGSCVVVSDRPELSAAIRGVLKERISSCEVVPVPDPSGGFGAAAATLAAAAERTGPLDAVVVALSGGASSTAGSGWERILTEHSGIVDDVMADAGWARAVAEYSAGSDRPVRLVSLTDATTAGGRSRAQAAAQLSRAGRAATGDRVLAFAVSVEGSSADATASAAHLAGYLLCSADAGGLAGAELAAGDGWVGLRNHPRPRGSVILRGNSVPPWFDTVLHDIVDVTNDEEVR